MKSIDVINDDMLFQVDNTQKELDALEAEREAAIKDGSARFHVPGKRLRDLLLQWERENLGSQEELEEYSEALWLSLEEFER